MDRGGLWQNREVRFDVDERLLKLTPGEILVEKIGDIEDVRGKNGDNGTMTITNFRIIWRADNRPKINMSIGYSAMIEHVSKVDKENSVLHITSRSPFGLPNDNLGFTFKACSLAQHTRLWMTLESVLKSYDDSKLEIEMVIQGRAISNKGNIKLLSMEQFSFRVENVWHMADDKNIVGILFVTNWRVVWCSQLDFNYSVSIPYLRMGLVRLYNRKNGPVLVIKANTLGGYQIFGWRVFPTQRQTKLCYQIQTLLQARRKNPLIGTVFREDSGLTPAELAILDFPLSRFKSREGYTMVPKDPHPTPSFE